MRLVRIGIAVQVTAMIACVLLTTPHLSNRLSNGSPLSQEGMSFVAWTVFLLPAVLLLLLSGWGMNGIRRIWLLLGVDIWLLGAMVVFSMLRSPGPPGTQLDRLPYAFITAQGLLITLPAVLTLLFGLVELARLERSQRHPPTRAPI